MNQIIKDETIIKDIQLILKDRPDALRFLSAYSEYCHRIDDLIDEDDKKYDANFILETFALGESIFSCNFYHEYYFRLYPLVLIIGNTYKDSVKLERSSEQWKLRTADVLRHCAHDMLVLVIFIVTGSHDLMHQISMRLREYAQDDDLVTKYENLHISNVQNS